MSIDGSGHITDRKTQRWIMTCAALAAFMGTLDEFIVNVSLPTIATDFGVGTSDVVWVVMAYLLTITTTLVLFGRLADRYGIRRLFLTGYAVFVAGSLMCGLSWALPVLIGSRFTQGIGASILRVVAYALVVRLLPKEYRGWGYGILSTASALGIVVGTPLGGLLTGLLSWHWVFLVNVPIGLAALVLARRLMPPDEPERPDEHGLDLPGVLLLFLSFGGLLWGLNNLEPGTPWLLPTAALAVTVAGLALFIRHERTTPSPLLDLTLFRSRGFTLGSAAMFLTCVAMTGDGFLMPFFLHLDEGLSATSTGFLLLVYSITYVPTAQIAGRLSDRVRPYLLCTWAMVSCTLACFWFAGTAPLKGLWAVVIYLVWAAASCAMFFAPGNNNVMSSAPEDQQGSASGVLSTAVQLGSVIGVVAFEAVFSFGGERVGADTMSELQGNPDVFIPGFQYAYLLGAIACAASAVLAFRSGASRSPATIHVPA